MRPEVITVIMARNRSPTPSPTYPPTHHGNHPSVCVLVCAFVEVCVCRCIGSAEVCCSSFGMVQFEPLFASVCVREREERVYTINISLITCDFNFFLKPVIAQQNSPPPAPLRCARAQDGRRMKSQTTGVLKYSCHRS